jgi:hypothetical protein
LIVPPRRKHHSSPKVVSVASSLLQSSVSASFVFSRVPVSALFHHGCMVCDRLFYNASLCVVRTSSSCSCLFSVPSTCRLRPTSPEQLSGQSACPACGLLTSWNELENRLLLIKHWSTHLCPPVTWSANIVSGIT